MKLKILLILAISACFLFSCNVIKEDSYTRKHHTKRNYVGQNSSKVHPLEFRKHHSCSKLAKVTPNFTSNSNPNQPITETVYSGFNNASYLYTASNLIQASEIAMIGGSLLNTRLLEAIETPENYQLSMESPLYVNKSRIEQNRRSEDDFLKAILCVLLPPLAVFVHEDTITDHFWICLLLSLFLWLPGIIYALLIVFGG